MQFPSERYKVSLCSLLAGCLALLSLSARADAVADQGKQIYTQGVHGAPACVTCHGAHGEGMATSNFPFLAGQGVGYLKEQLLAFHDGKRKNAVMQPIAEKLDATQREAVVAYIHTLPPAFDAGALASMAQTQPEAKDMGAWIANRGDWAHQIPACIQCHAAGGIGVAPVFPAITGLSKAYIVEQFTQWRSGNRFGGPQDLMGAVAKRMDDAQINAVATYFSGLPQANHSAEATK